MLFDVGIGLCYFELGCNVVMYCSFIVIWLSGCLVGFMVVLMWLLKVVEVIWVI